MPLVYFITHPEVVIDPAVPVPEWGLSEVGWQRIEAMLAQPWLPTLAVVYSSRERKAREPAAVLARHAGVPHKILAELGEIDRSATGYLERAEHDRVVAEWLARPDASPRGWERAVDAQRRIVVAIEQVVEEGGPAAAVAVLAHGGVGALLACHLKGVPIAPGHGPPGMGYFFCATWEPQQLVHGWRPVDVSAVG